MRKKDKAVPNQWLRQERERRGWSRAEMAERLNVADPKTIGRWERGIAFPSAHFQRKLQELFGLNAANLGLLPRGNTGDADTQSVSSTWMITREDSTDQATVASLPAFWYLPFKRNPYFTGREDILSTLHARLLAKRSNPLPQTLAISGLGGVGKTQVAIEYAYRYGQEYRAVFWLAAETRESLIKSFQQIADLLQLPERQAAEQSQVVAAVQRWFSTHPGWLLIGDNVEDLELLQRNLPSGDLGVILLTTRAQALATLARKIELTSLEQEEGVQFVLRRAKVLEPEATYEQMEQFALRVPNEYRAASELVEAMGGLPLALDQAGAYIEETGCSVFDYLQRYQQVRAQMLDRRGILGGEHPHSVTATILLASEQVEEKQKAAADLLRVCTFLHAEAIPEELFSVGVVHLGLELQALAANPSQLDLTLAALRSLSLVQRYPETHTLSIHRLVQTVLYENMSEKERMVWLRRVIAALNETFPEVTHEVWRQCERLLPHVLVCETALPDQATEQVAQAEVLRKAGDYLRGRAQYEQAERLYQRALGIFEQVWGPEHPETATSLNSLAILSYTQGKYGQAEALYQQALHIREQVFGSEHPEVATSLNGLAVLYRDQGKYEQAEPLYQRALHIREQSLGLEHPKVFRPLTNLGVLYMTQGKYGQAETYFKRALHIGEKAFGPEHPDTASLRNNLATLYAEQGKYEQAEPLFQQTLHIGEQTLGLEHPNVAYMLANLAELYTSQEKYEQAEPLYQQALCIQEKVLGPAHPQVAVSLNGLADLYTQQGKNDQAGPLYERTLRIREQHLGPDHPDTAQTLHDLASFQQKQGNLREAISLAERALKIRSQSLNDAHPKTVAARELYAQLLQELEHNK